jgi:hypothetical protein
VVRDLDDSHHQHQKGIAGSRYVPHRLGNSNSVPVNESGVRDLDDTLPHQSYPAPIDVSGVRDPIGNQRSSYPATTDGGEGSRREPRSLTVPFGRVADRQHQRRTNRVLFGDDQDDHRRACGDANVVESADPRVADARHRSPNARRNRDAPGSLCSPESIRDSRQFLRDLSGVMSSSERAHRAFGILAGAEGSFRDIDSRDERSPPGRNVKRTTEMFGRDESWLLRQSHKSAPDRNFMVNGREEIRTDDNMTHDDMRRSPTARYDDHDRVARARRGVAPDVDCDARYVHQQDPSGVQRPSEEDWVIIQRGETTRTSRNDARMFQDAEQRRRVAPSGARMQGK